MAHKLEAAFFALAVATAIGAGCSHDPTDPQTGGGDNRDQDQEDDRALPLAPFIADDATPPEQEANHVVLRLQFIDDENAIIRVLSFDKFQQRFRPVDIETRYSINPDDDSPMEGMIELSDASFPVGRLRYFYRVGKTSRTLQVRPATDDEALGKPPGLVEDGIMSSLKQKAVAGEFCITRGNCFGDELGCSPDNVCEDRCAGIDCAAAADGTPMRCIATDDEAGYACAPHPCPARIQPGVCGSLSTEETQLSCVDELCVAR